MANYGNNICLVPLTDAAGITQYFKPGSHYGIDIGWHATQYCDVLACQDGKVCARGYFSDTGYYVALEHNYTAAKRWSCYIHLKNQAPVTVGQSVVMGQKIGTRGTSGNSTGVHLHFYLTKEISKSISFSFTNLKKNAVDPVPYLYYNKQYNTIYISKDWTKEMPEPQPPVVEPVEKDITKDQIICHTDDLRVRKTPSLSGSVIGHLQKDKYYNYFNVTIADDYKWYKISAEQWVAGIEELEVIPGIKPVEPVERDERLDQVICHYDKLRIRTEPNLNGTFIAYLQKDKYYNFNETAEADGYIWYCLDHEQWVAGISELEVLPAKAEYIVQDGDTLESIAAMFGLSIEELLNLNPQLCKSGDRIRYR